MRILICASDAPLEPANTGFRRQLKGLLPGLGARHDVRLVGYRMPDQSTTPATQADMRIVPFIRPSNAENAKDLLMVMGRGRPLRADRLAAGLRGPLREELERFDPDIVHVGPGKLAGLLPDLGGRPCVLGVMDTWHLNVEARAEAAAGLRRRLFEADVRRIRRFEAGQYRGFGRVVVSNSGDLSELRALDPTLPFAVIPIGFDASAYAPDLHADVDVNRIIFHGAMSYAPNVMAVDFFARSVLPRVRAARAEAHMVIVGRDPDPRVLALDALDGVRVTGGVDDMRGWLTSSAVWVGPFLSGTGIKTKLLEAMATDLPCVVTPLGARGVEARSGEHLLVGSTEDELAGHVVQLLEDPELARRIGRAGGDFVRPTYDWPAVALAYEGLYDDVIAEHQRRPVAR